MFSLNLLVFASSVAATLSGQQKVSTHDYEVIRSALDKNPVFCGYPGSKLDLSRITAVQSLTQAQCGACLKVCNAQASSKCLHLLAVDKGGVGLDMNTVAFKSLFNQETGLFEAKWEQVNSSFCSGILKSSGSPNPGPQTTPTLPSSPSTYPSSGIPIMPGPSPPSAPITISPSTPSTTPKVRVPPNDMYRPPIFQNPHDYWNYQPMYYYN